jgi:hypothetical protein
MKVIPVTLPDEGYSSNVPGEGYSSNVPDEGYSSNVPDEGYSRNVSCALHYISMFYFLLLWYIADRYTSCSIKDLYINNTDMRKNIYFYQMLTYISTLNFHIQSYSLYTMVTNWFLYTDDYN